MMICQSILTLGLVCALTVQAAIKDDIINMYKNKFNGDGTYYGTTDGGTCQYDPPSKPPAGLNPIIRNFVALNKPQFMGSYSCGMCFKVNANGIGLGTNPIKGHFVVFVADLCPECKTGSLDFAINGDGRWKIEIQAVQCPVGNTKLEYKFQGSNPYYIKLQIRNARIPAVAVKLKQNGSWKDMSHTSDGFWTLSDGKSFPTHNIDVQITSANGETVHDTIPELVNAKVLHGSHKVQFALDGNLPTT